MKSDFKSSFIEGKTGMCLERDDDDHRSRYSTYYSTREPTKNSPMYNDYAISRLFTIFFFTFTSSTFLLYSGRRG